MAVERKPIDPQSVAIDLLRLERIEVRLARDVDALTDRQMRFPSALTQHQLDKATREHESVTELIAELQNVLDSAVGA